MIRRRSIQNDDASVRSSLKGVVKIRVTGFQCECECKVRGSRCEVRGRSASVSARSEVRSSNPRSEVRECIMQPTISVRAYEPKKLQR